MKPIHIQECREHEAVLIEPHAHVCPNCRIRLACFRPCSCPAQMTKPCARCRKGYQRTPAL